MLRRLFCLFLLALLTAGCSGGSAPSSGGGGASAAPPLLTGRVYLGIPVAGATVSAEDAAGRVVARTTTDRSGNFSLDARLLPAEFRVLAIPPGGAVEFAAEVRDHRGGGLYVVVNVPTTLASRFLRSHPSLTLAEAEARVKDWLGMSQAVHLAYGVEESVRSPFSHIAFWAAAAQAGGWTAYSQTILDALDARQAGRRFLLTRRAVDASKSGLEPGVSGVAALAQASPLLCLAGEQAEDGESEGSAVGAVLKFVGEGLGSSVLDAGLSAGWTWLAQCMGLNFGTGPALEEIQADLNQLLTAVQALQVSIDDTAYETAVADLNESTDAIGDLMSDYDLQLASAPISNVPLNPPNPLQTFLNEVGSFDGLSALQKMQDYMLGANGQTNLITLAQQRQIADGLGIDQPEEFMRYPFRSSQLLGGTEADASSGSPYFFYEGFQTLACNYLAENANNTSTAVLQSSPVTAIRKAFSDLRAATLSLKQQRQQLPASLLSDQVLVDLEFGVMWYTVVQDADTFADAQAAARQMVIHTSDPEVVYDGWRVATLNELLALRERGRFNPVKTAGIPGYDAGASYGDYGQCTAGLPGLGFVNVDLINSDGDVWCTTINPNAGDGVFPNYEFRMNHEHSIDNLTQKTNKDKRPYLVCRSLGTPVLSPLGTQPLGSWEGQYPSWMVNTIDPHEFASLGVPVAVSGVAAQGGRATASVTFQVRTGGRIRCGNSAKSQSFSLDTRTYQATLTPQDWPPLAAMLAWVSKTTALLDVSNYPGEEGLLVWHNDADTPDTPVDVQVSILGYDGSKLTALTATGSLQRPADLPARTLTGLLVNPRNRVYGEPPENGTTDSYHATGYYSDGSVADLTDQVTWVVTTADGQVVPGATFRTDEKNKLELTDDLALEDLVVQAVLPGSLSDFTQLRVELNP